MSERRNSQGSFDQSPTEDGKDRANIKEFPQKGSPENGSPEVGIPDLNLLQVQAGEQPSNAAAVLAAGKKVAQKMGTRPDEPQAPGFKQASEALQGFGQGAWEAIISIPGDFYRFISNPNTNQLLEDVSKGRAGRLSDHVGLSASLKSALSDLSSGLYYLASNPGDVISGARQTWNDASAGKKGAIVGSSVALLGTFFLPNKFTSKFTSKFTGQLSRCFRFSKPEEGAAAMRAIGLERRLRKPGRSAGWKPALERAPLARSLKPLEELPRSLKAPASSRLRKPEWSAGFQPALETQPRIPGNRVLHGASSEPGANTRFLNNKVAAEVASRKSPITHHGSAPADPNPRWDTAAGKARAAKLGAAEPGVPGKARAAELRAAEPGVAGKVRAAELRAAEPGAAGKARAAELRAAEPGVAGKARAAELRAAEPGVAGKVRAAELRAAEPGVAGKVRAAELRAAEPGVAGKARAAEPGAAEASTLIRPAAAEKKTGAGVKIDDLVSGPKVLEAKAYPAMEAGPAARPVEAQPAARIVEARSAARPVFERAAGSAGEGTMIARASGRAVSGAIEPAISARAAAGAGEPLISARTAMAAGVTGLAAGLALTSTSVTERLAEAEALGNNWVSDKATEVRNSMNRLESLLAGPAKTSELEEAAVSLRTSIRAYNHALDAMDMNPASRLVPSTLHLDESLADRLVQNSTAYRMDNLTPSLYGDGSSLYLARQQDKAAGRLSGTVDFNDVERISGSGRGHSFSSAQAKLRQAVEDAVNRLFLSGRMIRGLASNDLAGFTGTWSSLAAGGSPAVYSYLPANGYLPGNSGTHEGTTSDTQLADVATAGGAIQSAGGQTIASGSTPGTTTASGDLAATSRSSQGNRPARPEAALSGKERSSSTHDDEKPQQVFASTPGPALSPVMQALLFNKLNTQAIATAGGSVIEEQRKSNPGWWSKIFGADSSDRHPLLYAPPAQQEPEIVSVPVVTPRRVGSSGESPKIVTPTFSVSYIRRQSELLGTAAPGSLSGHLPAAGGDRRVHAKGGVSGNEDKDKLLTHQFPFLLTAAGESNMRKTSKFFTPGREAQEHISMEKVSGSAGSQPAGQPGSQQLTLVAQGVTAPAGSSTSQDDDNQAT